LLLSVWFYTQVRVSRKLDATNAVYDFADSGESTAGCASLAWQALGEDAKRKHNTAGLFSHGFKVEDEATFLRVSGTMTGYAIHYLIQIPPSQLPASACLQRHSIANPYSQRT
jgi:hypothetical protein